MSVAFNEHSMKEVGPWGGHLLNVYNTIGVVQPRIREDEAVSPYIIKECNTTHQCTLFTYSKRTLHVL